MSAAEEEWRPVAGWEGLYEVSSYGRVRRLDRLITKRTGKPGQYSYPRGGGVLKRHPGGSRRAAVRLYRDGRDTTLRVVNLVLDAFGIKVACDETIVHANGDVEDCSLDNLRVVWLSDADEEWRDISFAPGYQASSAGRIRSLTRRYIRQHRNRPVEVRLFGAILSPQISRHHARPNWPGYPYVNVVRNTEVGYRSVPVHHLIADAFHGPRRKGALVCHRDGDPHNSRPSNLYYGSFAQNVADMNVKAFASLAGITIAEAWAIVRSKQA